jgi:hypothetical protein
MSLEWHIQQYKYDSVMLLFLEMLFQVKISSTSSVLERTMVYKNYHAQLKQNSSLKSTLPWKVQQQIILL